ncbi:MAG: phosphate ABC transporter permease subunit PstC [Segniliparus sp.]|uniref:phosphate ABC transporter permease subunit PstC n=1 Tax=Segniliparus sp. TaxID=2804064 RepID=UPI003F39D403
MTLSHNAEDRLFRYAATGSSALVSAVVAAIGVFLLLRAAPALAQDRANFLTSRAWDLADPERLVFGMAELALVTVLVSAFALALAAPIALGVALFVSHYAPRAVAAPVARMVDLLAAVPSIVYGLWGWLFLAPKLAPLSQWLAEHAGWLFLFHHDLGSPPSLQTGRNLFTTGIVLAVMILPVITAISREVFAQTPHEQMEAALALGATKWEVVRMTVLPFGRNGFIAGTMLGLGRALGETMAVYLILATVATKFSWSVFDGGSTIASKIALGAGELDVNHGVIAGAYIAIGLVLFVVTFVVNSVARFVARRGSAA